MVNNICGKSKRVKPMLLSIKFKIQNNTHIHNACPFTDLCNLSLLTLIHHLQRLTTESTKCPRFTSLSLFVLCVIARFKLRILLKGCCP